MRTRLYRTIRSRLNAIEVPLLVLAFVLGSYLAVGTIFIAANVPNKATWTPWSIWFVLLLVSAVSVPLYALYETVEARLQLREKLETQASRDLALACQQIVAAIADACPAVAVNDLAACVWRCRSDGGFDELARFYLPYNRPPGSVSWGIGKGVAGWAWAAEKDLRADLRPLISRLDADGSAAFNALDESERFGLSAAELDSTRNYTGVCAIRLFSTDGATRLLGMLILDYVGEEGFDCVAAQAISRPVTIYTGACATVLTEASATL